MRGFLGQLRQLWGAAKEHAPPDGAASSTSSPQSEDAWEDAECQCDTEEEDWDWNLVEQDLEAFSVQETPSSPHTTEPPAELVEVDLHEALTPVARQAVRDRGPEAEQSQENSMRLEPAEDATAPAPQAAAQPAADATPSPRGTPCGGGSPPRGEQEPVAKKNAGRGRVAWPGITPGAIPAGSEKELALKLQRRLVKVEEEGLVLTTCQRPVSTADARAWSAAEAKAARQPKWGLCTAQLLYASKRHSWFDFEELEQEEERGDEMRLSGAGALEPA